MSGHPSRDSAFNFIVSFTYSGVFFLNFEHISHLARREKFRNTCFIVQKVKKSKLNRLQIEVLFLPNISPPYMNTRTIFTMHEQWSFPLRISSINVPHLEEIADLVNFAKEILHRKLYFSCSVKESFLLKTACFWNFRAFSIMLQLKEKFSDSHGKKIWRLFHNFC